MTDTKQQIAFLFGMKLKQVRKRLNKSLEETAGFLNMSVQDLNSYESGSLEIKIGSANFMKLFRSWGATYKDVFFYQLLNEKNTQEIFDFYKNPKNGKDSDYVEHLLTNDSIETKNILERKLK